MDDDVRKFGMEFGRAALARSWDRVHGMLAPWLRSEQSVAAVQAFFEDAYRETLQANDIEELCYPEHQEPRVDGNRHTNATKLREPISFAGGKVRTVASEVTDQNMRYWMSLQLQCSDAQAETMDFDTFCEIWLAVVETPEGLRVGYWSQGAY